MPTKQKTGDLPDKEFQMIVKMIQNLENKMELQINSLETRIEKMQEMFNKGSERSPGEGKCNPLQYSCLENLMDGAG